MSMNKSPKIRRIMKLHDQKVQESLLMMMRRKNRMKGQRLSLDFPITPKAFLFRSFDTVDKAPDSDNDANLMLISFYLKHGKPQYQTWSSKKITTVKVFRPIETESFLILDSKQLEDEQKCEPIVVHLKRMLISYIQEVGKMDVEIEVVLRKKHVVKPKESFKDINKMKLERIEKENWSVMFQQSSRDSSNV
ncbi:unnamed protein product [Lactuca saligna]|uniref:Uncharacterized protein n=1 Tax=Lactuca saligna TaxID=75948 RepID=A0AA36EBZ2_LACSI|nr:unnamed protein product [Lactuca saligna]